MENAWQEIEPQAKKMGIVQLYRRVQNEDRLYRSHNLVMRDRDGNDSSRCAGAIVVLWSCSVWLIVDLLVTPDEDNAEEYAEEHDEDEEFDIEDFIESESDDESWIWQGLMPLCLVCSTIAKQLWKI